MSTTFQVGFSSRYLIGCSSLSTTTLTLFIFVCVVRVRRDLFTGLSNPMVDETILYGANIEQEWEDMMLGGPSSINYLSALLTVASKKDFPLTSNYTFTYVKYPQSFQTTLVQLSNNMYQALFGAHSGMDRIQANMRQIPSQLKTALKLITQGSPTMIKTMLPRTLSNIGKYANESATASRQSLIRFEQLHDLLQEIHEASSLTNGESKNRAQELEEQNERMRIELAQRDAEIARIQSEYEKSRQQLDKDREEYKRAMLLVPGGEWESHAWEMYAAHRPAISCGGSWFWRSCRSNRDYQFQEYTAEAKGKADAALVSRICFLLFD